MRALSGLGAGVAATLLVVGIATAFSPSEKQVISALRARIVALEDRVTALETERPAFAFSNITAVVGPPCHPGACYTDISWNVEPCATGQVEYGLTSAYGAVTTKESRLLCFHRQRIRGLDPDTDYHYRLIATDGAGAVALHTFS